MNIGEELVLNPDSPARRLTHYLLRYPAKFHAPVVRLLLKRYTKPGDVVLDPFVGSGTLLIEAATMGRHGVGLDVDPLAIALSQAKTRRYDLAQVANAAEKIIEANLGHERSATEYERLKHSDMHSEDVRKIIEERRLPVPAIPNIEHWFRRYVIIDLAHILMEIDRIEVDQKTKLFLRIVFASIIRNSSNADPVPVSGLEYTAHMKRRDEAGRLVNPFALYRTAMKRALAAIEEWDEHFPPHASEPEAYLGNAMAIPLAVPTKVDAIITSPPYNNAVDYYRRHQLEMFWLGQTKSQEDRLALLPNYIGRPKIPNKDPLLAQPWKPSPLAQTWESKIRAENPGRAQDFRHYLQAMSLVFSQLAKRLNVGSPAVIVLGQSQWRDETIPTESLLEELARPNFSLQETLCYPIKNRYMSYSRRNSASIDKEYVLALRRT